MIRRHSPTMIAVCLLAFVWTAPPLKAQTVSGQIIDMITAVPIADASVVLVDEEGEIRRGMLTMADGTFTLEAPEEGPYTVRVGAPGYLPRNTPVLNLEPDRDEQIEILLEPEGVTGPPPGFYERMRKGDGWFITREQIEERAANQFTQIFEFLSGVTIIPLPPGDNSSTKTLRIRDQSVQSCVPELWVDNRAWGAIDEASSRGPDDTLQPIDILGIEVYPYLPIVPDQFNTGPECRCGVIVVWTTRRPL